jgi:hypothetical protein
VSGNVRRDRIVGATMVAVGVLGLLASLALGRATSRGPAAGARIGLPPPLQQDRESDGDDRGTAPDWMDRMLERMQRGPLDGQAPGRRDPGRPGQGGMLQPPGADGLPWHRGPWLRGPNASPAPEASPSPGPETSPSPSPTAAPG